MLSSIQCVDLIVLLPVMENDNDYLNLVMKIKPDIIAVTEDDPHFVKKRWQAEKVGATLKIVSLTKTFSTSKLAELLGVE